MISPENLPEPLEKISQVGQSEIGFSAFSKDKEPENESTGTANDSKQENITDSRTEVIGTEEQEREEREEVEEEQQEQQEEAGEHEQQKEEEGAQEQEQPVEQEQQEQQEQQEEEREHEQQQQQQQLIKQKVQEVQQKQEKEPEKISNISKMEHGSFDDSRRSYEFSDENIEEKGYPFDNSNNMKMQPNISKENDEARSFENEQLQNQTKNNPQTISLENTMPAVIEEVGSSIEDDNINLKLTSQSEMVSDHENITYANLEQASSNVEPDSESDFGDFSDASFEEFQPVRNSNLGDATMEQQTNSQLPVESPNVLQDDFKDQECRINVFPDEIISDIDKFKYKISDLVDQIFADSNEPQSLKSNTAEDKELLEDSITKVVKEEGANGILNERAKTLWQELKNIPKLNPPDWKRSAIRRHFMISIGVPIDLNEVSQSFGGCHEDQFENGIENNDFLKKIQILFEKVDEKKEKEMPVDANDEIVFVRSMNQLKIDKKTKDDILQNSLYILNGIEEQLQPDLYYKNLLKEGQHDKLEHELNKFESLKDELEKILSVWNKELSELNSDHDTFLQVVENIVGYSQKLTRQESLKNLGKNEKAKRKNLLIRQSSSKTGFFWNT